MLKRLPFVLAYIIVDACRTAIANEVWGLDPRDAEFRTAVKVVWKPKGERECTVIDGVGLGPPLNMLRLGKTRKGGWVLLSSSECQAIRSSKL